LGFEEFIRTYPDIVELVIDSTEQKKKTTKKTKENKRTSIQAKNINTD